MTSSSSPDDMSPAAAPDDRLLERFVLDECSTLEHVQVEAWLAGDPERAGQLAAVRSAVRSIFPTDEFDLDRAERAFFLRVQPPRSTPSEIPMLSRRVTPRRSGSPALGSSGAGWWRVARTVLGTGAAVAIVGALVGTWFGTKRSPNEHRMPRHYVTAVGERAKLTLADGSDVWLAPGSRLDVPAEFGRDTRALTLAGEAYFSVKSSSRAPFEVRTGSVTTRVLGTAFTVRHYAPNQPTTIAVVSGRVSASGRRTSPATIAAGTVAQVTDTTIKTAIVSNIGDYSSWTRDRLVFVHTPVSDVLAALGRWYDYRFQVADSSIVAQHVSAVFKTTDDAETLSELRELLNVTTTVSGRTVTLARRRTGTTSPVPRMRDGIRTYQPQREVGR